MFSLVASHSRPGVYRWIEVFVLLQGVPVEIRAQLAWVVAELTKKKQEKSTEAVDKKQETADDKAPGGGNMFDEQQEAEE